jgi:tripartite-type tricarboxylate transporter receptor subunit TctC
MRAERTCLIASVIVLCLSLPAAAQDAVADFYRGKQVTVMVGFTPGGSSSLYAQGVARHMGRFLPGNPSFIVQHVPGASGLVLANNLYNTVPRDGTAFGITGRTAPIEPLLGQANAKFDGRRFSWIGTANVEYTTCIAWHTAPVKTLADAMTTELIVGGSGADATEVIFPKAANKLVGTKFKVVLGYPGSTELLIAMERGETQGFCGIGWTFSSARATGCATGRSTFCSKWRSTNTLKFRRCRRSSTTRAQPTTARCSSSCSRRRRWGGRSSRHPMCRLIVLRRCGAPLN